MLGPEEVTEMLVNQAEEIPPEIQEKYGIIPRSTFHMFDLINRGIEQSTQYVIKCSYIEIYNEQINDLLCNPPAENLRMREFPNLGMCVIGMTESIITSPDQVFDCLSLGTANRITCATGQNSRSSRSHTVFILVVEQKLLDGSSKVSKLNLVDLAGSEKLSKTGAEGQALKEAQNINLSLTTLGRCINALTAKKPEHIPYRESKLTMILKESLGGNSKTSLICTASQKEVHKEESITTLKFAERAKLIQNKAKSNVAESPEQMRIMIEQLRAEVASLKRQLEKGSSDTPVIDLGPFSDTDFKFLYDEMQVKFTNLQINSERELEDLRRQLEQSSIKAAQSVDTLAMHEEILDLKDQIDEGKKQVVEASELLSVQRQKHVEEIRLKQIELEKVQSVLELTKTEGNGWKERFGATQNTAEKQEKELIDLNSRLNATNSLLSESQKNATEKENLIQEKEESLSKTQEKLNSVLFSQLESENLIKALNSQIRTLEKSLLDLQMDNSKLTRENESLNAFNSEFSARIAEQSKTIENLHFQVQSKITIEEAKLQEQKSRNELNSTIQRLEAKMSENLNSFNLERENSHQISKSLKLEEIENLRLNDEIVNLKAEILKKDKEIEDLHQEIEELHAKISDLNVTFQSEKANFEAKLNEFTAKIREVQRISSEKESKLQEELISAKIRISALETELASARKIITQRELIIEERQKGLKRVEDEKAKLQLKVTSLEHSIKMKSKESANLRKNSVFSQVMNKQQRGSVINSQVKVNTSIFGVVLKKTNNPHLQQAVAEAERARKLAPKGQYQVYYGAADIRAALYSSEDIEEEQQPREEESSSSSSSEEEEVQA